MSRNLIKRRLQAEPTLKESSQPARPETIPYYSLPADQVLAQLESSPRGLTSEAAAQRLVEYGPNIITKERGTPLWH